MNSEVETNEPVANGTGALNSKELLFKFLIIGDYGVGKTAVVRRYSEGKFSSNYKITIGADFAMKTVQWDKNTKINLQLWDIAGHERFGYMTRVYYKHAIAAALVFDVSRIATFHSVEKWLLDLREKVALPNGDPVPIVLLANKCDIQGVSIPTDSIHRFCRHNEISAWFVTSAKENINIDEAMTFLIEKALRIKYKESISDSFMVKSSEKEKFSGKEKPTCCN